MPTFHYKRQAVHYELYGREGDPVITFCNGLSMRTSHWAPYFEILPKLGCRVLTYDMLGQGASSKPILGVDFDDHAATLHALHEHLGIENPYVMGISFGGVVVLKYAYTYPDRIKGLIPISTFSELDQQLKGHAYNLYKGLVRVGFEFYLDLLMPLNFSDAWMSQNAELLDIIKRVGASSNELYGIQNLMESLQNFHSITEELPRIQCPTLILNGEYDALTPRHLHDLMRRQIADSRMVVVPHVCHAFTLEIPKLTSRLLADFVHQVEAGTWRGDQSTWIASDDADAEPLLEPFPGDPLRFIPVDAQGRALKSGDEAPGGPAAGKRAAAKPAGRRSSKNKAGAAKGPSSPGKGSGAGQAAGKGSSGTQGRAKAGGGAKKSGG